MSLQQSINDLEMSSRKAEVTALREKNKDETNCSKTFHFIDPVLSQSAMQAPPRVGSSLRQYPPSRQHVSSSISLLNLRNSMLRRKSIAASGRRMARVL